MAKEFNYRDYLKNNPLLNEAEENKDIEEEVKKSSKKTTIKELKASIRERILAEMEDNLDEASAVNWRDRNSPAGDSLDLSPRKVGTSTVEEELEDMDEAEEVDVEDNEDINIDIEDEIDIDDESSKSEIEVDSELAGEDSDVAAILGLLTKAQSEAEALGDEKLMDQIGNTITYYTRAHVVK
tara:strand:- start:211 stop:759 length:549 start_codon:yes stop_codon:yes gene_type:complete